MHWSKISLAMLRALSLAGVIGVLVVSGGAAFARNGNGHGDGKQAGVKTARIVNTIYPIIVRKKHHRWYEHRERKHRYPYPGRIRGPLPPTPKPPPSMQGGMPPGRTIPTAPAPAPKPPAPAPAPGGAAPAPAPAPAPGGAAPAPAPTPGGGEIPAGRRPGRNRAEHGPIHPHRIMNSASRADGKSVAVRRPQARARRHAGSGEIPGKFQKNSKAPRTHPSKRKPEMSSTNSRDRSLRIAVGAATILLALSIGGAAQAERHGGGGATAHPTPPVKSSYDPSKSVIRDHRTPAGYGASAIPAGDPRGNNSRAPAAARMRGSGINSISVVPANAGTHTP